MTHINDTRINPSSPASRRIWFVNEIENLVKDRLVDFVIVSFDLTDFKIINLIFGPEVGDRILSCIYTTISARLLPDDIVVRDTADVFYALFHTQDRREILDRLQSIRRDLDAFVLDDSTFSPYLEMRFGVYIPTGRETSVEMMLELANIARKHSPKELVLTDACFYDSARLSQTLLEKEHIAHLIEALDKKEFLIYLQPKVLITDSSVIGAEALVRWARPGEGFIYPNDFVPLLERYRLVHRLDVFVFRKVCELLSRWKKDARKLYPISINISRQTLDIPNLLNYFQKICIDADIEPELIEFEITEHAFINSMSKICSFVTQAKQIGFKCSIDDFGDGYSSLGCLNQLMVDSLKPDSVKLDRSFFSHHEHNDKTRIIVKAITDLLTLLGCQTVAEGIEDKDQLKNLKETTCRIVQGYVFYRPMTTSLFEESFVYKKETE